MKKLTSSLLLLCLAFCLSAQQTNLRDNVAIVRPNYSESSVKFLTDFSKYLNRYGYYKASDLVKAYAKGGFGSGFVYTDAKSGKSYIVSNRHVAAQANTATIEFTNTDSITSKYLNCPVVTVDEQLDLALIELPAQFKANGSFNIVEKTPGDASDVFTAGYPGLGSEPSWQVGNGIISNSSVKNKYLTGDRTEGVIQHTAQIDAGSSGGPLLVRNTSSSTGYDVIGVNTWKAEGRENANFAISGKSLHSFLNNYMTKTVEENNEESLKKEIAKFTTAINKDYKAVQPYISSEYVANISIGGFYDLVSSASDSVRKEVEACFDNGRPIDGVRVALAEAMYKKYNNKSMALVSVNTVAKDSTASVTLMYEGKETPAEWVLEQGDWRIKKLSALRITDLEKNGISKSYGYGGSLFLFSELPMGSDLHENRYGISYMKTYRTFVVSGFTFGKGNMSVPSSEYNPTEEIIYVDNKYFYGDIIVGGQLPIKVSSIYLVPNIKVGAGILLGNQDDYNGLKYEYSAGVDIAYKLGRKNYLIGGLEFKRNNFLLGSDNINPSYNSLGIRLGITW